MTETGSEPRAHEGKACYPSSELLHCGDLQVGPSRVSQKPQESGSHTLPPEHKNAYLNSMLWQRAEARRTEHPNSHPEALVFPATCYSLAVWTPVNSIHLNGGRGWTVACKGEGQPVRTRAIPAPLGLALPHQRGQAGLWPVSGPSHPTPSVCCHCCH